jgi:VIT1/CCC1 family predicted Fe2+/Mn2+ transporter
MPPFVSDTHTMAYVVALIVGFAAVLAAVMATTATGARRRGARPGSAVLAGVFFPATWIAWYDADRRSEAKRTETKPS